MQRFKHIASLVLLILCMATNVSFAGGSCSAVLSIPKSHSVYRDLAMQSPGRIHLTCPVNVESEREATIFVLNDSTACGAKTLLGFSVLSHQVMTTAEANDAYGGCSGVIRFQDRQAPNRSSVTYLWDFKLVNDGRHKYEPVGLYGRISGVLISSGLPIHKFVSSNGIYCFEVDIGFHEDPLSAILALGVKLPPAIHQSRFLKQKCSNLTSVQ